MSTSPGRPIARPATTEDREPELLSRAMFAENYPSLFGLLAKHRENPKFHATGCITVFWEDGVFKVSINDRPEGRSCFVSHQELAGALRIADSGIRSGTLRWRVNSKYRASARTMYT